MAEVGRHSAVLTRTTHRSIRDALIQNGKTLLETQTSQLANIMLTLNNSGEDCPAGMSSILTKWDQCWKNGQKYCCPNPIQLTGCHWVSGSSGSDCANAICNATEIEIDKSTYGDKSSGCDCNIGISPNSILISPFKLTFFFSFIGGRSRAGCCTITKALSKRSLSSAICSANPCDVEPNLCNDDPDAGDADAGLNESTLVNIPSLEAEESNGSLQVLNTQGRRTRQVHLSGGILLNIIFASYPRIGQLFGIGRSAQVLREAIRLLPNYCADTSIKTSPIGPGKTPNGLTGLQTEHPVDVRYHRAKEKQGQMKHH